MLDATERWMATSLVRDWLTAGNAAWVPVAGESMAPYLPDGSRVLVVRAPAVRPGDVVVHENAGRMVCHRVVRRRSVRGRIALLTRGDAWRGRGRWIADRRVIGTVVAVDRHGRRRRVDTAAGRAEGLVRGATMWARGRAMAAVDRIRRRLVLPAA